MKAMRQYTSVPAPELSAAAMLAVVAALFATVPIGTITYTLYHQLHRTTTNGELRAAILALAVAIVLQVVASVAAAGIVRKLLGKRAQAMRVAVIEGLRRVPARQLADVDAGRCVAILTTGLDDAVESLGAAFDAIFSGALTALFTACVLLVVDWRIGLVALMLLPVALGYVWQSRRLAARASPRLGEARSEGTSRFFEYVSSVGLLRAFGATAERARRLGRALSELQVKTFESSVSPITYGVMAMFFVEFGFGVTMIVAATIASTGGIGVIALMLALLIALFYFQTMFDAVDGYVRVRDAAADVFAVGRLLEIASSAPASVAATPADGELTAGHVTFAYDRGPVLENVSLRFAPGSTTAIVGPSGAGKSALAGVLAGLWEPLEGSVTVGGVEAGKLAPDVRARTIALVFQDTYLSEDTIRANIAAGRPGASDDEIRRAATTANCDEFVARFPDGYDTMLKGGGANLSAGERQRIAIARALVSDASIVLFDECTASLDAAAERAVHRAIEALAGHKTVVLITHRMGTVRTLPNIVVLAGGRVVETGTHAALLGNRGEYARLWAAYERAGDWKAAS